MRIFLALFLTFALTNCFEQEKPPTPRKRPYRHVPARQIASTVPVKIAVIDTGFGFKGMGHKVHLCKQGHKDFSQEGLVGDEYGTADDVPLDTHGHGTNIAGIIDRYAGDQNFCLVILKYFSDEQDGEENLRGTIKAIHHANIIGVDVINYSGGGIDPNKEEEKEIKAFLDRGGIFIAAAGNEGMNSEIHRFYPANYDKRTIVVGALKKIDGDPEVPTDRLDMSNYGKLVNRWELGMNVAFENWLMTGTSQATAIATGKIVHDMKKEK